MAKPRAGGAAKSKQAHRRRPKRSFSLYIHRTLSHLDKHLKLSGKSMKIFNSFVNDMFERITGHASALARANKRRTLGSREVQTAVRLALRRS